VTVTLAGLKLQEEFAGRPVQEKVNTPVDPLRGARVSVYLAVCPLGTVWLDGPEGETAKSNPMPERLMVEIAANDGLEIVRFPACGPAAVGAKSICMLQPAPGSREDPQLMEAIWKAAEVNRERLETEMDPLFVNVTV